MCVAEREHSSNVFNLLAARRIRTNICRLTGIFRIFAMVYWLGIDDRRFSSGERSFMGRLPSVVAANRAPLQTRMPGIVLSSPEF